MTKINELVDFIFVNLIAGDIKSYFCKPLRPFTVEELVLAALQDDERSGCVIVGDENTITDLVLKYRNGKIIRDGRHLASKKDPVRVLHATGNEDFMNYLVQI